MRSRNSKSHTPVAEPGKPNPSSNLASGRRTDKQSEPAGGGHTEPLSAAARDCDAVRPNALTRSRRLAAKLALSAGALFFTL